MWSCPPSGPPLRAFIHDFTWPEIQRHCTLVCRLFDWYAALGFPKG